MNNTIPPFSDRFIAGSSYGGFSILGLIGNIALFIVLLKNRSTFSANVFYKFVWQLMLGDMGILLAEVIVSMPLSLSGKALYGEGYLRLCLSSIDTVSFYIVGLTSFFISINRLTVFVAPRLNEILFTKPVVYIILAIPWSYAIFWASWTTYIGCPKTFSHTAYYFMYNCSSAVTQKNQLIYFYLEKADLIIPVISLVFYGIIFAKLRLSSSSSTENSTLAIQQRKRERSFLLQALIICISLELEILGFTYMPNLAVAGFVNWYWITLLIGWIIILNSSINPIIYFVFNQSIREAFLHLISRDRHNVVRPIPLAMQQSATNSDRRQTIGILKHV